MAIGYDGMTASDVQFYWNDSYLFYRQNDGSWEPYYLQEVQDTVMVFAPAHRDMYPALVVSPLDLFYNDRWISYLPELGYVDVEHDGLVYLSPRIRRERARGLSSRTVNCWLFNGTSIQVSYEIATALAKRMSNPQFPITGAPEVQVQRVQEFFESDDKVLLVSPEVAVTKAYSSAGALVSYLHVGGETVVKFRHFKTKEPASAVLSDKITLDNLRVMLPSICTGIEQCRRA